MNSQIKMYNNRPTIFLDDQPVAPVIYALTDWPGGRLSYEESTVFSIKRFASTGIRLYQLDISFEDMWFEDGTLDISIARKQIQGILDIKPDAAVFFRLHTNPPKWWYEKNRTEWVAYADTDIVPEPEFDRILSYLHYDQTPVPRASFASDKWLIDMTKMVKKFLTKMQKTPESKALCGIHIASGLYGEHHYWCFVGHDPDTSECMNKKFKEFTGNPDSTVPDMNARYSLNDGIFRDPKTESDTIDYFTCQHELVAKTAVHFCKLVKETWNTPIITGIFYGYYFSLFGRAATGGHLAEQIILSSEYIDYISAPQGYDKNFRLIGGAGVSRGLLESALINKKLLLDEVDHPTHLGTLLGGTKVYPEHESLQILRRNAVGSFLSGMGFWYYDFGPYNTSGWWNASYYLDEIKKLQKIFEEYYKKPYVKNADVLLVFDTQVQKHTALNDKQDPVTDRTCLNVSYPASLKSGASIDTIYLSDIEKIDLNKYKCIVFMNTFCLDNAQKEFIRKNLYENDRAVVWFFAPGYTDTKRNDISFCEQVSNFNLAELSVEKTEITVNFGNLTYSLDNTKPESLLNRLFVPTDGQVLGYINGTPAFSKKKVNGCNTYFSSIPFTTPEPFRFVFKENDVHIYDDKNDSVLEGSRLLMIHAQYGGPRRITFKDDSYTDILLKDGQTLLIDTESGKIIAG